MDAGAGLPSAMTEPEVPATARSGLTLILAATVIAGAAGYGIQAVVPALSSRDDYITFGIAWSAMFLIAAGVAGVQQEITRAASPRGKAPSATRALTRFSLGAAGVFVALVLGSSFFWAPSAFGARAAEFVPSILVGTAAYTFVAVLSGVFYGARRWRSAAGMTVADSLLRLVAVFAVMLMGLSGAAYAWAIALPFAAAFVLLWFLDGRRAVQSVRIDGSVMQLGRHSVSTVGAALATGVMISGLPLVLGVTSSGLGARDLAALILVITLTRAPLVIPLMALQSYLVVTFRDRPDLAARRTLAWGAVLIVVTVLLSAASVVVGPWVIELLYQGRYSLAPAMYSLVIASAGLTALLCLTGPAALARGRHRLYVAGWGVSSLVLLLGLGVVPSQVGATVSVIAAAPVIGVAIHLWALRGAPVPVQTAGD
ncbi:hypothetical protein MTS1_03456 [Microbacterium sp. TS-1]|nr:hypothetical protein MTS1_03456 [Microbacterium sp. TS-1]